MSKALNRVFKRNRNFPWQTLDSETVIIDPENQFSFELNEVGSLIWNHLDGQTSLSKIKERILETYDQNEEEVEMDLLSLVGQLAESHLIQMV
ncbi:MAG: PqqD family protein [Bdellovibrionales bacterium]|nr:PqqD family protein [Bdellovibrionales bacterium]